MYSPDSENLTGVAGLSAGSEGVTINGKDTLKFKLLKECQYVYTLLLYNYNYCILVSDCVCEGSGGSCTGMRSLDGALEVSGRMASFVGVASAVHL